jgi:hypothetical protein
MIAFRFGLRREACSDAPSAAGGFPTLLLTRTGKAGGVDVDVILTLVVDIARSMTKSKPVRASSPMRPCLCSKRIRKSKTRKVYSRLSTILVVGAVDDGDTSETSETDVALDKDACEEHCESGGRGLR